METQDAARGRTGPEVLCLGETMALGVPEDGGRLRTAGALRLTAAGAESNTAQYLADLGHRTAWAGALGDDPFGRRIRDGLAARGVDTRWVRFDPDAPTAVFFKDPAPGGTRVHYYRRGSAASRMTAADAAALPLDAVRVVHLSGITPALSAGCAELVDAVLDRAAAVGTAVSLDINHRPALWPEGAAGPALEALARRADLAYVGRDEAEALWGTRTAAEVAERLRAPGLLVVKDGGVGATEFDGRHGAGEPEFVPAPAVEVVEPVGAGDAFAAGHLSGFLRGLPAAARLHRGHRLAGRALRSVEDFVPGGPLPEDAPDPAAGR